MLSIVGAVIMIASHWHPAVGSVVLGTKAETSIIITCLAFAIVLVAIITGPGHGLAVDNDGSIAFGNQYYFSWVGLFTTFIITQNLIASRFGVNVMESMRNRSKSFSYWMALIFCSIVVMGSSSEYYGRRCSAAGNNKPQPFCSRCVFGITVGLIGIIFASGIVIMKITRGITAPYLMEVGIVFWLFLLYLFEVAFITDNSGPGAPLGNLYYFSWISFLLTIAIANACHEDLLEAQQPHQQVATTEMPNLGQVPNDNDTDVAQDTIIRDIERDSADLASSTERRGAEEDDAI